MKILEHNVETGEVIERDAMPEELEQAKVDAKNEADRLKAREDEVLAKQAILDRLGLTAEEARLLFQ
jgi:hypothetical protein